MTDLQPGKAVCLRNDGYNFTVSREYVIERVEPRVQEVGLGGFTWPEYAHVLDDTGKKAVCHSSRFRNL